nr:odorant binding protein [Semanotus bifasciatus]
MNFFIICVICFFGAVQAAVITEEQKGKLLEFNKQCMEETHVDMDIVMKASKGVYTDDPTFKKHIFCVNKKAGFQNAAGDLQIDTMKAKINSIVKDEKKTNEFISKCALNKDTPENTAFEVAKCFHNISPEKDVLGL